MNKKVVEKYNENLELFKEMFKSVTYSDEDPLNIQEAIEGR